MADLDSLTSSQQAALGQLQALTNGADIDVEIAVLKSVDWDVQRAAEEIFDSASGASNGGPAVAPRRMERMELDDSQQYRPHVPAAQPYPIGIRLITYPFTLSLNLISSLLNFVLRILRIPFPSFTSIWRPATRRALPHDPASAADRWVRALEEETGAVRGVHGDGAGRATGAEAEAGPGPSTLSRRGGTGDGARHLPEFFLGAYEEALRIAQKEARVLCVVLVSDEHDDVAEFKKSTLTDPDFNMVLKSNAFLVWGGDVREREAHQAAQKLSAITYPFIAFVALQPRPRSSNASQPPVLTILSRHQGPAVPSSASIPTSALGPTSPVALCNHLTNQLLPRVTPFLERLKATQRERERERVLREEQDAAFAAAAQRDRTRIERKIVAEREQRQAAAHAMQARTDREAARAARAAARTDWARYARRMLLPPEPPAGAGALRIVLRLPDGRRLVRSFAPDDTLTALYAFAAAQALPPALAPADDPVAPPAGYAPGEAGVRPAELGFAIVCAYPRAELRWAPGVRLGDVEALRGGAQLVVETTKATTSGAASGDVEIGAGSSAQDEDGDWMTDPED